jgi:hypothetical protein
MSQPEPETFHFGGNVRAGFDSPGGESASKIEIFLSGNALANKSVAVFGESRALG